MLILTKHSRDRIRERSISQRGLRRAIIEALRRHKTRRRVVSLELSGAYEGVVAVCEVSRYVIRVITVYRKGF